MVVAQRRVVGVGVCVGGGRRRCSGGEGAFLASIADGGTQRWLVSVEAQTGCGGEAFGFLLVRETLGLLRLPLRVSGAAARIRNVGWCQPGFGEVRPPSGRQLGAVEVFMGADFRAGVLFVNVSCILQRMQRGGVPAG